MTRPLRPALGLLATTALALALGGCKFDNRPLLARGQPQPDAYAAGAPAPGPLDPGYAPYAPATAVSYLPAQQAYAYPARAYRVSRAYYSAPPSYAFAYGEEQPWAWQAADNEDLMFAEPVDDGYRYYYYQPGEAYPYFVQDPQYGYAYGDSGVLLALFDATGALLSGDRYASVYDQAPGYWRRGYALDEAYRRSPRYPVGEVRWRERAPAITASHERWFQAAAAQPAWREVLDRGDLSLRHDNGRHLGWAKDRGGRARVAQAAPAPRFEPGPRADRGGEGGPTRAFARAEPAAPREAPPPHGWRQARQAPQAWAPGPAAQDRGGGGDHGRHGGGPQFSRAAESHGQNAGFRGPEHAQPQGQGQGEGQSQGHPGGGHGNGNRGGGGQEGGGHGGGKGGDHGGGHGH